MQEELQDYDRVLNERLLEVVDVIEPLRPDLFRHELVDARDDHILVVRPVEDPDHPPRGNALMDAPEEVMLEFDFARDLEAGGLAAHRIDAAKNLLDCPVFAGRIAALEDDEKGVPSVRVQRRLQFPDSLALVLGGFLELVALGETARARGICVADADLPCAGDGGELGWVGWHETMSKTVMDLSKI